MADTEKNQPVDALPPLPEPKVFVKQSEWHDALTKRQSFNGWRVNYGDCDMHLYTIEQVRDAQRAAVEADRVQRPAPPRVTPEMFNDLHAAIGQLEEVQAERGAALARLTVLADRAQQGEPVARLDLLIQVDNLCSQIENTLYAFRGDDEAVEQAKGAIEHAKKVAAPYRAYRAATKAAAPADAPKVSLAHLLELVEQAQALPEWSTTAPIPLTPIQIAYVAGKLADLRATPAPDTGIPNAGDVLTDERIDALWLQAFGFPCGGGRRTSAQAFARAVEAELASGCREGRHVPNDNDNFRAPVSSTPTSGAVEKAQSAHAHRDDWFLMANARRLTEQPIRAVRMMSNWAFASELFATGSGSAHQICKDAGIDPYGLTVTRAAPHPSEAKAGEDA